MKHPISLIIPVKNSTLFFLLDLNECLGDEAVSCASNATCHNSIGSYRCICDNGFRGDGHTNCERKYNAESHTGHHWRK